MPSHRVGVVVSAVKIHHRCRDDDVAGERQPVYSTRALAKAIMPRYKGSLKRGRVGLLRQQARAAGATNAEEEVAATADDPVGAHKVNSIAESAGEKLKTKIK